MHLAYSALPASAHNQSQKASKSLSRKCRIRYRAYKAACKKYEQEIAAIQQYMPGWQPAFNL
ncbi:hypothetical protein [Mucilaginibacter terrae]|nr:hypothetical protein [Mucilaginibacter terrae]